MGSLIEMVVLMSNLGKTHAERDAIGNEKNPLRLSVGCKPIDTYLNDMQGRLQR